MTTDTPQPQQVLPYSPPQDEPPRLRWSLYASIALALLGFPVGVATSILLETTHIGPGQLGERTGFLVFALFEGLAAALGILTTVQIRALKNRGQRTMLIVAIIATILGVAGSGAVLLFIYCGKIR